MTSEITKKYQNVAGVQLAYVERGVGAPIFLHGNPTSSYLWRNVLEPLSAAYRCIAPDLVGMGDSEKLPDSAGPERYSFFEQQRYLDALIAGLELDGPVILVLHDWGSALGFDWARRFPERVRGIAYMEAIVGVREWADMPPQGRELFEALRSERGEQMILEQNMFLEQLLPGGVLRQLAPEEQDEYRRPFREQGESRRAMLSWPRALPFSGEPPQICEVVTRYAAFLARSDIPKLFVNADPGRALVGELREGCRRWPNQREVTVRGLHYVQEDSPGEVAAAIGEWASALP